MPFKLNGSISRDQINLVQSRQSDLLLRKLRDFSEGNLVGFADDKNKLFLMDQLIKVSLCGLSTLLIFQEQFATVAFFAYCWG